MRISDLSSDVCSSDLFAFVLFSTAVATGVMQPELSAMLVLVVTISMMATPPLFSLQTRLRRRHEARPYDTIDVDEHEVLIAGFGPFGPIVSRLLRFTRLPLPVLHKYSQHVPFFVH